MAFFKVKSSEPVVTDNTVKWQQEIAHAAMYGIIKGLAQSVRDKYNGHIDWTYNLEKQAHLLSLKFARCGGGNVLVSNLFIPDEKIGSSTYRMDLANKAADACIKMLLDDFAPPRMREELPNPSILDYAQHPVQDKPKKKPKPKKICPLCGPEDPYYPPWPEGCPHEEAKRKKKRLDRNTKSSL